MGTLKRSWMAGNARAAGRAQHKRARTGNLHNLHYAASGTLCRDKASGNRGRCGEVTCPRNLPIGRLNVGVEAPFLSEIFPRPLDEDTHTYS